MSDYTTYEQNDPTFVADLLESNEHVWRVARWLSDLGYNVTVKPLSIRPDVSQMGQYSDNGDLEITQRIEVKRRPGIDFSSPDDFPYPTVIVDVAHAWDKARPKPYGYVILNASATACLVVKGDTAHLWQKLRKWDRAKQRERTFYECPVEICDFFALGEVNHGT